MMEKNILLLFNSLDGGGAEKVMYDLYNELKNRGLKISYFLSINKLAKDKNKNYYNNIKKNRLVRFISNASKLISINKKNIFVISALHEENFLACLFFKRPILTIHNSESPRGVWIFFYYFLYGFLARYKKAKIICVSKGLSELYKSKFPNLDIGYIYNGLFLLSTNPVIKECNNKYLMIGRFVLQKNHIAGIYAFKRILQKNPKATLTIVGEGPLKKSYEELIGTLNISKSVEIQPWNNEINSIYIEHNILLFPSLWEGFGNVIIEALHYGLNIIAVDCEYGPREILFPNLAVNEKLPEDSIFNIYGCLVKIEKEMKSAEQGDLLYAAYKNLNIKNKIIISENFNRNNLLKFHVKTMADRYIQLMG